MTDPHMTASELNGFHTDIELRVKLIELAAHIANGKDPDSVLDYARKLYSFAVHDEIRSGDVAKVQTTLSGGRWVASGDIVTKIA